jgi:hypothetical protein
MGDNCSCGIPDNAVILNQLHIVEFLDPNDGDIYKLDLSTGGDGDDLPTSKYFELCEWGRMMATAPIIADMVHDYIFQEDDGDGEEESVS